MKTDAWLHRPSELGAMATAGLEPRSPLLDTTVMMVDDEPLMIELIEAHLEDAGFSRFVSCSEPFHALDLLRRSEPGVLLLDLMMPGLSGFDILTLVRTDPDLRTLPVIVLTAAANAPTKLRALQLGATDFLAKPVDSSELVLRVRNALAFSHFHEQRANLDSATGLPNARAFERRFKKTLAGCIEGGGELALLNITVPECAALRETLGQQQADELARVIGKRLSTVLEAHGFNGEPLDGDAVQPSVVRLGDDAFGLVLPQLSSPEEAEAVAWLAVRELAAIVDVGGHECQPTPSIGIAIAPGDGRSAAELMKAAELARSQARQLGGTRHEFFSPELNERSQARLQLANGLRHAASRGELRLHYQPKVSLADGGIVGVEALVRWQHPQRGLLPPAAFIALAEEQGLIVHIGEWVLTQACADGARWLAMGLPPMKVAINVSRPQFESGLLCERLRRALDASGLPPKQLVVELTESMLMKDGLAAIAQMEEIKALGVTLSVDDFGTGYSSLSYLKRFPIDELKIDRSFVMDLPGGDRDMAIVRGVTMLGHDLGLRVVAEGVETHEQRDALHSVGCDEYQGFLFSRPVPVESLELMLRARRR